MPFHIPYSQYNCTEPETFNLSQDPITCQGKSGSIVSLSGINTKSIHSNVLLIAGFLEIP